MDLSKLSIAPRTRNPWEAADLGVTLTKAWWRPLFLSWFIPAAFIFLLSSLIFHQFAWLGYVLIWWLKPLLDRGALYIASRRLFGDQATFRDLLANASTVYRRDWFWWLTIRRFSPTRSLDMPLTVLEQLSGKARSNRQRVLHLSASGAASWFTFICVHVEMFIVFGIGSLLIIMVPEEVDIDLFNVMFEQEVIIEWVYSVCIFAAMCLVGPFYAVAGFVLYISRRIDLEAWDIEIRFRHLASEQENKRKSLQNSTLSLVAFVCTLAISALLFLPAPIAQADEISSTLKPAVTAEARQAKEDIIQIKLGEDFHQIEQVSGWRLKNLEEINEKAAKQSDEEIPEWSINFIEFLSDVSDFFKKVGDIIQAPGAYIEFVLWGLAAFLVIYIIYRYRQLIRNLAPVLNSNNTSEPIPDVMFGMDVREQSIPDNVAAEVYNLWKKEDYRDAVSLLYRSTLAGLIHYHKLDFSASDTEGECLQKVKENGEDTLTQFFSSLTVLWQSLAYGHQLPEEEVVKVLCERWDEVLRGE